MERRGEDMLSEAFSFLLNRYLDSLASPLAVARVTEVFPVACLFKSTVQQKLLRPLRYQTGSYGVVKMTFGQTKAPIVLFIDQRWLCYSGYGGRRAYCDGAGMRHQSGWWFPSLL